MKYNRLLAIVSLLLVFAQIAVVLLSWIVSAVAPSMPIRSLLSEEGVRWMIGSFSTNIKSDVLVWLCLWAITYGAMSSSGLSEVLKRRRLSDYRQRFAARLVLIECFFAVFVMLILTLLPDAVLLNVQGRLFPSSLLYGLIPFVMLTMTVASVTYGVASGRLQTLTEAFSCLTKGFPQWFSYLLVYLLSAEFVCSICFVFMC